MDGEGDRQQQQAAEHQEHREPLEPSEIAGARGGDDEAGRDDDARDLVEAEIVEREADADEFGDDRQCVEQKEVDDAESAPEPAEPLEDQPGVPDAGHRAEAQHHLLIDVEHRNQQRQRPQQGRSIGLTGLAIGGERARVIVAGHHDEAGAENGEQRREAAPPGVARGDVAVKDGAEGAADVADVSGVEHGGLDRLDDMDVHRHGFAPFAVAGSEANPPTISRRGATRERRRLLGSVSGKEPVGCDRSAPTGRLGPSFNSVSSSGRERSNASKGARRSCGVEAPTPCAGRHPVVTCGANPLKIEHDRPRRSTNAVPFRMIPRAGFVNLKNVSKSSDPVQPQKRFIRVVSKEESNMVSRLVPGGVLAAAAGAALMVVASSGRSSAFTLSSPSLDQPAVAADIQPVWWDRWGRWHPNHWGWGVRHPYWHPYYHPWRRCWWTWHGRVCRW